MAKDFGRAASAKTFGNVSRVSGERANVLTVRMIHNSDLLDYPRNGEDIRDTADLENSIRELGFTDPLEVTPYGAEDGKYTIISGHRRRVAGVNTGMEIFPCIVRGFPDDISIKNYVLLSNSQRDSSKDPLLYCKRYKMHEQYLRESGFDGSYREEIAKRLGISVQQADRYNQFNKIILPVWDMVRDGKVGMSSVLPMAVQTVEEQQEIYSLLSEYAEKDGSLTREICDEIIKSYRDGNKAATLVNITPDKDETPVNRGKYEFKDPEEAVREIKKLNKKLTAVVDDIYNIGREYDRFDLFKGIADNIVDRIQRYVEKMMSSR